MLKHILTELPLEACGILVGKNDRVEETILVTNAAQSSVRFLMDAQEQWQALVMIEESGQEMLSVFHSHPTGPPFPSPTDIAEAAYPVVNIIWSPDDDAWQARGFWIEAGKVSEVALLMLEGE